MEGGKDSGLVTKIAQEIALTAPSVFTFQNGGHYDDLQGLLDSAKDYDVVFWWPNVPNDLPKVRDVKETAPHVMLVSSKRNDGRKYGFDELVGRALASKSNLVFEFSRPEIGAYFDIRVFDPLGSMWYEGQIVADAVKAALDRLAFLRSITRNSTTMADTPKELVMAWYFDRFKEDMEKSDKTVEIPPEEKFVDIVKAYAETFQELMPQVKTDRMLGNASMRPMPPQVGRCGKGIPSFRKDGYIFVSRRNVDKRFLSLEDFVPAYIQDGKIYYCGDSKPSVDTPIQLRLYEAFPGMNYMIHSHCYIKGAQFTRTCVPCGAVEEVGEIVEAINGNYGPSDNRYVLNLIGHGSIVIAKDLSGLGGLEYYARPMPEKMF